MFILKIPFVPHLLLDDVEADSISRRPGRGLVTGVSFFS